MWQYQYRKIFGVASMVRALALYLVGCGKKSSPNEPEDPPSTTGTFSFTLNGGGFSNRTITFRTALARYDDSEDKTGIAATGISGTDSVSRGLVFPGNRTGTFSWTSPDIGSAIVLSNPPRVYMPVSGTTTVSAYGAVGSTVRGTFSGTVSLMGTTETVTVSNGQFSATRIE